MTDATQALGIQETDSRLRFLPLDKAADPPDGFCRVIKDCWWCVCPKRGLIFFSLNNRHDGTPQCNANESIARSICAKLYPWAEVRYVPVVFRHADPRDYT